jgi:threonine/homoserine/homoserine lactone efflux protein
VVKLLPLFGVWLLAVMSPGPDFLVVVQQATGRSRRHGILAGLGVSTAIMVWAGASMLGLSVVLTRISWTYDVIRLVGAAYLVYLGMHTLWSARRRIRGGSSAPGGTHTAGAVIPAPPAGLARAWRIGFLTNLGNPKAAVFFGSLLGALVPVDAGIALRVAIVAVMVSMAVTWFGAVALLFGLSPIARLYERGRRWIDRIMAAVFIALGGRLALER